MADHSSIELLNLCWFLGWCIALLVLFGVGLRLPLQPTWSRAASVGYTVAVVVLAIALVVVANAALRKHDAHFDLTRERVFTPSRQALEVVDHLDQDVDLLYFYQAQDAQGKRLKELVEVLGRRNPRLHVRTIDPDKQPSLATTHGVRLYNAAVLEAAGRRLVVQSTDENDIAIGIQRVLRQRLVTICFMAGHNEYPIDNDEFHTHLEGLHNHRHDDASSSVVQMPGHGIGRLRRALEAQGYEVRTVVPATQPGIPPECNTVINANPRTTYLPTESDALEAYLQQGGAVLLMYDLGFVIEPRLVQFLEHLGVRMPQAVVIDPQQHYATDPEMVAVGGLEAHAITKNISLTFFPGVRPLERVPTPPNITPTPLILSSKASYTRSVEPVVARLINHEPSQRHADAVSNLHDEASPPRPHVLAVAVDGTWTETAMDARPFRAVIIGDGDFASNSFLPYMANSDLALSMVRWLLREDRTPAVASRIPVPPLILLTKLQMRQIFLFTEIVLPFGVLVCGAIMWWKRR